MKDEDLGWLVRELRAVAGDLNERNEAPVVLAIDQGGHASRAIAFDRGGAQLAESFTPISTYRAGADRIEHDPQEIVDSIRTSLEDIAHTLGTDSERVIAVGIATQRSSVVCWDKRNGKPLSPVLSWQDRRNAAFVEKLRAQATATREQTGLVLSPHYGASKLRWCLDEVAAVRKAREDARLCLGPLASFLLSSLLEERPYVVDPANASRTQLWDPSTRTWSPSLTRQFGVPIELLPRCVSTRYAYGRCSFAGREIPLSICTGDQSAVPFAFGAIDPGTIYLNLGTGAFLQRAAEIDDPGLLRSVSFSDEQRFVEIVEGTVNGASSALDWLNARIDIDTHRSALALKRANVASSAPIFINGVGGVGSPYWQADRPSYFMSEAGEPEQVQGVVESIAFLICRNIERMSSERKPQRVLASGGLSSSDYLCECIASLSNLPVERAGVREATALGLAFLIAGEPADWNPPNTFETFSPEPDASLLDRYRRWAAAMDEAPC
jgi:glycerol kinase